MEAYEVDYAIGSSVDQEFPECSGFDIFEMTHDIVSARETVKWLLSRRMSLGMVKCDGNAWNEMIANAGRLEVGEVLCCDDFAVKIDNW